MLIKILKAIRDFKYEMLAYFAHVGVGEIITFACVYVIGGIGLFWAAAIGILLSVIVAGVGEWIDYKVTGNWNIMDIVATAFGGVVVLSLLQIAKGLL